MYLAEPPGLHFAPDRKRTDYRWRDARLGRAASVHQVWSIALAAIGLSLGLALRALLVKGGKRAGPLVADILYDRETHDDEELEQWLIEDLAADMIVNRRALARKMPLLTGAIALMGLAIILAFAGLVV
jgi:hypothetical protein